MRITVQSQVHAPVAVVWEAYTRPEDITQWNAASDDWHTPHATVDLRPGGQFCWRMEARDGSAGFDFAGTYTRVLVYRLIEYTFGERQAAVQFCSRPEGVQVQITFDSDDAHSAEQQQQGWQAALDRFARYVEATL